MKLSLGKWALAGALAMTAGTSCEKKQANPDEATERWLASSPSASLAPSVPSEKPNTMINVQSIDVTLAEGRTLTQVDGKPRLSAEDAKQLQTIIEIMAEKETQMLRVMANVIDDRCQIGGNFTGAFVINYREKKLDFLSRGLIEFGKNAPSEKQQTCVTDAIKIVRPEMLAKMKDWQCVISQDHIRKPDLKNEKGDPDTFYLPIGIDCEL